MRQYIILSYVGFLAFLIAKPEWFFKTVDKVDIQLRKFIAWIIK